MNIILAHGFLGFTHKFTFEYFAHIFEFLQQVPARVFPAKVSPTAGVHTRGEELRSRILGAFRDGTLDPSQKAHIIAHSMGGLDSRYVLSPSNKLTTPQNDVAPTIASLTTISTPHQGSPIADLVVDPLSAGFSLLRTRLAPAPLAALTREGIESLLNDLGISGDGLRDLTTKSAQVFNQTFDDHPHIQYRSLAGTGRQGLHSTAFALEPFFLYLKEIKGEDNDGLVPVSSAQHGPNPADRWPTDHADEIGHNLDNPPHFDSTNLADLLARYARIVHSFPPPTS